MGTTTNEATLEQTLNRTDLGHWLYENRKPFFLAIFLVFVGASSFLLWKQTQSKGNVAVADRIFEFSQTKMADFTQNKMSAKDLVAAYELVLEEGKGLALLAPVAFDLSNSLNSKGYKAEALSVLGMTLQTLKTNDLAYLLLAQTYMALAEDLGQLDQAIAIGQKLVSSGQKVLQAKLYLDLGRLFLEKKDSAQAKTHFGYVLEKFPNDEAAKLAKLYMGQIQ